MRVATRFRLLLLHDIAWFLFFFACCLSNERMAKFVGAVLVIVAERAGGYAQRLIGTLTLQQMRTRAILTVVRFLILSGCLVWADFAIVRDSPDRAPPGVLSIFLVPILLIFCYAQVRIQLGLEPLMQGNEPKPSNQAMDRTPDRGTLRSSE